MFNHALEVVCRAYTFMTYRGTNLLTLHINHTIYSSVENGRFKLKETEQFVIKLYYPFIINCSSLPWEKATDPKKTPTKADLSKTVY